MFAALWLFYPNVGSPLPPPFTHKTSPASPGILFSGRLYYPDDRADRLYADTPLRRSLHRRFPSQNHHRCMREKRKCGISFSVRCFCTGGSRSNRPRKSVKNPRQHQQQTRDNQRHAFDHLCRRAFTRRHFLLHQHKVLEARLRTSDMPITEVKITRISVIRTPKTCATWNKNRNLNINI